MKKFIFLVLITPYKLFTIPITTVIRIAMLCW